MKRRQILITAAGSLAFMLGAPRFASRPAAAAGGKKVTDDDRILGSVEAPITIIEYASMTCPHCANFHINTLPDIKKNWIETGKARLVYRDFPLDGLALRAAALATCIEGDRYFSFVDTLYRGQQHWARAQDPVAALAQVARLAGIDQATFESCISDTGTLNGILEQQKEAKDAFDISSTPTFVINGRKIEGARTAEQFQKELEAAE